MHHIECVPLVDIGSLQIHCAVIPRLDLPRLVLIHYSTLFLKCFLTTISILNLNKRIMIRLSKWNYLLYKIDICAQTSHLVMSNNFLSICWERTVDQKLFVLSSNCNIHVFP